MAKTHLRIRTTTGTFRRAGFLFTDKAQQISLTKLTKAQIEALNAEPALLVEEIEIKPAEKPKAAKK